MLNVPGYVITGKYMSGADIVGFQLTDSFGKIKTYKYSDTEKLISQGRVQGWSLVEADGKTYIHGDTMKLASLPTLCAQQKMAITHRMFKDGVVIGYVVVDQSGTSFNVIKEKVWAAARSGGITNATAHLNGKTKILRGVGMELRELPSIKV